PWAPRGRVAPPPPPHSCDHLPEVERASHRHARLEDLRDGIATLEEREVAWILVEHDGVQDVARRDPPVLPGDTAELGAARRRGEQGLLGGQTGPAHER